MNRHVAPSANNPSGVSRTSLQALRDALQIFWAAADGYAKRRMFLALAVVAAGALLAALTPIALKLVIDSLTGQVGGSTSHVAPVAAVAIYVCGQYLWRCSAELRMMLHGHAEQRVHRSIGARLFEHLVNLPLRFHLERKAGAVGQTAEQGMRGYQLLATHLIFTVLPVLVEFSAVAIVLVHFGHETYLTIIAVSSLAYMYAFQRGAAAIRETSEHVSTSHIDAHAVLTDCLLNHETVKYFDAEPVVCHRYDTALGRIETAWRTFFTKRTKNGVVVATIFAVSLGFSLVYAAQDVARGAMTVGDFVLVNVYVMRLAQPLELLGFAIRDVAQAVAFLGKMLSVFEERREEDGSRVPEAGELRGALALDNVSFAYEGGRVVLRNVTFNIPAGRTVAVVGVSGSGKSSLIRLLFRLYEPTSGRILLDGMPIAEMSLSALRQAIAVVPQDTVLFHDTIGNNIGFGRYGSTQPEIEEAAKLANLHEFILSLPEGYDSEVGERGLKLSGGERQRVAIARAALKRPRIFVFDEATSSLDTRTEREILRNLVDLSSRSTTLVIAHRLSTVVHADEIVVLDRGVIVERGSHDELRARNGYYAALWNAQQGGVSQRGEASGVSRIGWRDSVQPGAIDPIA